MAALLKGADRSATSLARLLLDCLELLDVEDATVVANDTAGGLLLLSLPTGHPALGRAGRLVLTNCDNYDQFPPDALRKGVRVVSHNTLDWPERCFGYSCDRGSADARSSPASPRVDWTTSARNRSSGRHDVDGEGWSTIFVAALGGFRPQLLIDAAEAIPRFDRPVVLIWGDDVRRSSR